MVIVGVDLAAKEKNKTGIAIMGEEKIEVVEVLSDEEILEKSIQGDIIVFDAPLSLPMGRCCLERDCECSKFGHFRKADLEIRGYGHVLPLTFPYMKALTFRGMRLKNLLESLKPDLIIIETHPGTARKLIDKLFSIFKIKEDDLSSHEIDAIIAAITGYFYIKGKYITIGDPSEGIIILPCPKNCL